jgi:hypothetical protein
MKEHELNGTCITHREHETCVQNLVGKSIGK